MYSFSGFDNCFTFECKYGYESCDYYIYDNACLSLTYHNDTIGEDHVVAEERVLWNKTAITAFKAAIALFFSENYDCLVCPFEFAIKYASKHEFFDEYDYINKYICATNQARLDREEN